MSRVSEYGVPEGVRESDSDTDSVFMYQHTELMQNNASPLVVRARPPAVLIPLVDVPRPRSRRKASAQLKMQMDRLCNVLGVVLQMATLAVVTYIAFVVHTRATSCKRE
uniref:Membrane protein V1 n=1 Tax=Human herpesvirus 3 TaxID=10335 RepID=G9IX63_HHV3|nr:hypothetical protein HHV3gp02 [Human alphaherpesvirus 3]